MKQEEKQLLIKDLCARLPYGVKIKYLPDNRLDGIVLPYLHNGLTVLQKGAISYRANIKYIRPYLRPMSSMTEGEIEELSCYENPVERTDFYYSHHIDCRFMIEKGLALEAPEGMYN